MSHPRLTSNRSQRGFGSLCGSLALAKAARLGSHPCIAGSVLRVGCSMWLVALCAVGWRVRRVLLWVTVHKRGHDATKGSVECDRAESGRPPAGRNRPQATLDAPRRPVQVAQAS